MSVRGIRGAITVKKNSKIKIVEATTKLLKAMVSANKIKVEDVACVIFSATVDLNAEFPALSARKLGWLYSPLLCTYEINVPKSIKKCIRVLLLLNTDKKQKAMKHVYLEGAAKLRLDLKTKDKDTYYFS